MFNSFHKIYSEGEAGVNKFKTMKITWERSKDRDKKWAEQELANIGKIKFSQEYDCEFLGSVSTVIDQNTLKILMSKYENPFQIDGITSAGVSHSQIRKSNLISNGIDQKTIKFLTDR